MGRFATSALSALLVLCSLSSLPSPSSAVVTKLTGSGATTLEKVFLAMLPPLNKAKGVNIIYNAVGSGAGRLDFISNKVQFACSDIPMSTAEEKRLAVVKMTLPFSLQSISVFVNIPGYTQKLNLTAQLVALIFSKQLTKWSDPRIKALNPKLNVAASQFINVVHRADSSGSTAIFTAWLVKKARAVWKLGSGSTITWPAGTIAAQGSGGVATAMKGSPFSIGYLGTGFGYAVNLNLKEAFLQNAGNVFVQAISADIYASVPNPLPAATATWAGVSLVDNSGPASFPMVSFTYVFARRNAVAYGATGGLLKAFMNYLDSNAAQTIAVAKFFKRLPKKLIDQNVAAVKTIVLAQGVKVPF